MFDLYEMALRESLEDGGQTQEPPAIMLLRAFAFGRITLNGMLAVVEWDGDCGACAATLCRPFYKLATRLLWASREPDGWHRLVVMWARQSRAWSQDAVKHSDLGPLPQLILDRANDTLDRAAADDLEGAPNMQRTLTDIESRDRDDGVRGEWAGYQYTGLWRSMSMSVHSQMSIIVRASDTLRELGTGTAVVATFALLRAMAVATSPDRRSLDKTIIAITNRMMGML